MELKRFTDEGIAAFAAFLDSCTTGTPLPWPATALNDPGYSEPTGAEPVDLNDREFASRFELAGHLHERFEAADFRPSRADRSLWSWIACRYFREICPKSRSGLWQPGALPRWIPQSSDWRRYYRHLVAGPYFIYQAHRDDPRRALALLCQKPGRPGDLVEQLASRQQIVTNPAIMEVATACFVDADTGLQRSAANRKGAGGARRFVDVLNQFDVTWDLSFLSPERLRSMLPPEFALPTAAAAEPEGSAATDPPDQ